MSWRLADSLLPVIVTESVVSRCQREADLPSPESSPVET